MTTSSLKFYRCIGMMIGAMIGVGVFGLPFVFAKTGVVIATIELLVMGFLLTILQLMQAEVAIQTNGKQRLVGYVRRYLGQGWSWIVAIALAGGIWGAMLAYIIVGGKFVYLFVSPVLGGTEFIYALVVAAVASALIYRGLAFASKTEIVVVVGLLFLFIFIILAALPHLNFSNLSLVSFEHALVPYGVILFSLAGVGIVPELHDILGKQSRTQLGHVILIGMGIIILLYAIFSIVVVGVTGTLTTEVAFDGLVPVLGNTFRLFASGLGTITILSIYFILGIELLNTLRYDFGMQHKLAWIIVTIVPVLAYLLGAREFISVVGFVGSVFAGTLGVIIALTYDRMKRSPICREHHCLNFPTAFTWTLIILFLAGIGLEIFFSV